MRGEVDKLIDEDLSCCRFHGHLVKV
jgi:hypothetical protein